MVSASCSLTSIKKEKLDIYITGYPTLTNALLTRKLFVGISLPQVSSRITSRLSTTEQFVISCLSALNQVNVHCACNFRIQLFTCLPNAVSPDKFGLSSKKFLTTLQKHPFHLTALHLSIITFQQNSKPSQNQLPSF